MDRMRELEAVEQELPVTKELLLSGMRSYDESQERWIA
jgi:hypothetical protein